MTAPGSENDSYEAPALLTNDTVLFPEMEATVVVRDSKNVAATAQAFRERKLAVLIPNAGGDAAEGTIGTLVLLRTVAQTEAGGTQALSKGLWRVRVQRVVEESPYVRVRFTRAEGFEDAPTETSLVKEVLGQIDEFVDLIPGIPEEIVALLKSIDSPGRLADTCAYSPLFTFDDRLDLLRTLDPEARLAKVHKLFERQLHDLKNAAKARAIPDCATCMDFADRAFEAGPTRGGTIAREFLDHVVQEHSDEVLALLAERYGPEFLRRRALK